MQSLIQELDTAIRSGHSVCYAALVETRGSTPRKAGAAMLVFPDGSQVGTVGGGNVEAEVKRRALQLLPDGSPELLSFQLDSDDGTEDALTCGGRMKILVDPVRSDANESYYQILLKALSTGTGTTEAIVVDAAKSGGGHEADRWLLDEQGSILSARAAGPPPPGMVSHLKSLSERPRPYIEAGISYLPNLKRCRLVIVGAGHVGQRVAELAVEVGFDVWVVDDRPEYCNPNRFPQARLIVEAFDTALGGLQIDTSTYCIIVTRGHNHDQQALFHLAETKARYLGMIGSRRKIKLIFDNLLREGISRETLQKVYAPLGLDIGSQTVPEIAISIVAELVAHRNLGQLPERIRPASILEDDNA